MKKTIGVLLLGLCLIMGVCVGCSKPEDTFVTTYKVDKTISVEVGTELDLNAYKPKNSSGESPEYTVELLKKSDGSVIKTENAKYFVASFDSVDITYTYTEAAKEFKATVAVTVKDTNKPTVTIMNFANYGKLGDVIALPTDIVVVDNSGEVIAPIFTVTCNETSVEVKDGKFTLLDTAPHKIVITATDSHANAQSQTIDFYVHGKDSINDFDDETIKNTADSTNLDAKVELNKDTRFIMSGSGSLKLTSIPRASETYPGFKVTAPGVKDISSGYGISFWVFNPNEVALDICINTRLWVNGIAPNTWKKITVLAADFSKIFPDEHDKNIVATDITNFNVWFRCNNTTNSLYFDEIRYLPVNPNVPVINFDAAVARKGEAYIVSPVITDDEDGLITSIKITDNLGTLITLDENNSFVVGDVEKYFVEVWTTDASGNKAVGYYEIIVSDIPVEDVQNLVESFNIVQDFLPRHNALISTNTEAEFLAPGSTASLKVTAAVAVEQYPGIVFKSLVGKDFSNYATVSFKIFNNGTQSLDLIMGDDLAGIAVANEWTEITIKADKIAQLFKCAEGTKIVGAEADLWFRVENWGGLITAPAEIYFDNMVFTLA